MFSSRDASVTAGDEGCSVCDHPFGHLTHACISSIGPAAPVHLALPILVPVAVVA
ncbi:hypothetical protein [Mycobacterium sp. AT1]|uniref:hypothetical protein n=1 Tax=Mycobacterium sp. AT1 TaxID=1961706 RepID=UPI001301D35D|nr:hypothetical protein [Mycobacterium sp. AT1]